MKEIVINKDYLFNSNDATDTLTTTDIPDGSVAYDVYTKKKYIFYGAQWHEF